MTGFEFEELSTKCWICCELSANVYCGQCKSFDNQSVPFWGTKDIPIRESEIGAWNEGWQRGNLPSP